MKVLDTEFEASGFGFKQVERDGDFAIYKRWRVGNEDNIHFEVIRITRHNGFTAPNGTFYPPAEMYPTAAKWGVNGFTIESKDRALEVMSQLIKNMQTNNTVSEVAELSAEITGTATESTGAKTKGRGRGRKSVPFNFPTGEFKVKSLAVTLGVSVPLIHIKMKEAGNKIKLVGKDKVVGQKGRAAGIYQYVDTPSPEAQTESPELAADIVVNGFE